MLLSYMLQVDWSQWASPVDIHNILLGEHHSVSRYAPYRATARVVCVPACLKERHREMVCPPTGKDNKTNLCIIHM